MNWKSKSAEPEPMLGHAVISSDGRYRYVLGRSETGAYPDPVVFVMLNPSTADAENPDPTITRCIGFARAWGYSCFYVVNLFGFRSSEPKDLAKADDAVGPKNDCYIEQILGQAKRVVVAWGAEKAATKRVPALMAILNRGMARHGHPLCLGVTKSGAPRHPLFSKKDAELTPWTPPSSS